MIIIIIINIQIKTNRRNFYGELEYNVNADVSQEDIISLMIENITLEEMIKFYNKKNGKTVVSKIEADLEIEKELEN